MSSNAKRMCLTRDQRAVLEAVYAMEKLPDADLRERLSSYLNLSTRQVQVWFQNRRQRAKANGPKKTMLSTSDQIMDALLEFSGDSATRLSLGDVLQSACARSGHSSSNSSSSSNSLSTVTGDGPKDEGEHDDEDDASDERSEQGSSGGDFGNQLDQTVAVDLALVADGKRGSMNGMSGLLMPRVDSLDRDIFDMALPCTATFSSTTSSTSPTVAQWASGLHGTAHHTQSAAAAAPAPMGHNRVPDALAPITDPSPADAATEALLGYACHSLRLGACEYWQMPPLNSGTSEPTLVRTHLASCDPNGLNCCRGMLASALCEAAACTRENAWFGATTDQQELLARAGVALRTVVAAPCIETNAASGAKAPSSVCGLLVLYSHHVLSSHREALESLMSALGAAVATARSSPAPPLRRRSFLQPPPEIMLSGTGCLLRAAAHALQVDVVEQWSVRRHSSGGAISMVRERGLASEAVQDLAEAQFSAAGGSQALHPFSSQLSRAALYAAKLIWCNPTTSDGVLEGIKLPMQTAIGLPIWSSNGTAGVFLLYSLSRREQTAHASLMLQQLQQLASSSAEPHQLGFAEDERPSAPPQPELAASGGPQPAAGPPAVCRGRELGTVPQQQQQQQQQQQLSQRARDFSTAAAAPLRPPSGQASQPTCTADEAVMSTDQVLSLIDGLSDELLPMPPPPFKLHGPTEPLLMQPPARMAAGFQAMPQRPVQSHTEPSQRWSIPGHMPTHMPGLALRTGCSGDLAFLEM